MSTVWVTSQRVITNLLPQTMDESYRTKSNMKVSVGMKMSIVAMELVLIKNIHLPKIEIYLCTKLQNGKRLEKNLKATKTTLKEKDKEKHGWKLINVLQSTTVTVGLSKKFR